MLNSLYEENDVSQEFKDRMQQILEIFIIEEGDNMAFAMADFTKVFDKNRGYIFLLFDEENNKCNF